VALAHVGIQRSEWSHSALQAFFVEDAHIWVSLPSTIAEEGCEQVANQIAEKSLDILLAEGFLILVGLEEPAPTSSEVDQGSGQVRHLV